MRRLFGVGLVAAAILASASLVAPASAATPKPSRPTTPKWITAPDGRRLEPAAHGGIHGAKLLRATPAAVTGTVHWVILRCAYQSAWPQSPFVQSSSSYLDTMLSDVSPGLADYWHKASYGAITVAHTVAGTESEWRPMPHPNSAYGYVDDDGVSHITASGNTLFDDCASVWDDDVNFHAGTYYAALLDQYSAAGGLGGGWPLNMDGVATVRGLLLGDFQTEESFWAHEMGHAYGLQHSLSQDDPYNIYDTAYDIMSSPGGECFAGGGGSAWEHDPFDPRYARTRNFGCIPGQTLAWNKAAILGWIPNARRYLNNGGTHTFNLEESAEPVSTTNPLYALLPVSAHVQYTVEARLLTGISSALDTGFDENFAARIAGALVTKFDRPDVRAPVGCVVINEISDVATAPILMGTDDNHDGWWDDPGTCFTPGETWTDPTGKVTVQVNSIAASSFNVTVTSPRPPAGTFVPLSRQRILATGTTIGGHPARLGPGAAMSLGVLGVGGVPSSGVDAVVLNLHALNPSANSVITAWPAGVARPATVNLRTRPGETTDGLVTVKPGTNGQIRIYNAAGSTGLAADVVGYYGRSFAGLRYQPVFPFLVGTVTPQGLSFPRYIKIPAGGFRTFAAEGYTGAPITPNSLVAIEVEEVNAGQAGNLKVYRTGTTPPPNPDVHYPAQSRIVRQVIVPVNDSGQISIANIGTEPASVAVELIGWYGPDAPDVFHALSPTHALNLSLSGTAAPKAVDLTGSAGVPNTGVTAIVGTVSVTHATTAGSLTLRPTGESSSFPGGVDVAFRGFGANAVAPKIGANGRVSFASTADANVGLDVVGWFGPH